MKGLYGKGDYEREGPDPGIESEWRPPFTRDYGRVVHSSSFRRLQGKTQVFPGHESDFFRNRLTHSLEVAQIAEGIADRLNCIHPHFQINKINGRLCAIAALMHDLGHPPFGHNGERALDDAMIRYGGFEGNAQSLRIVTRNEKKVYDATGQALGLNLTLRSLAAILKYDRVIPRSRREGEKLVKGYYASEEDIVRRIKSAVLGSKATVPKGRFRTIECSIMDIADDIAYSTYDLEDCLKAEFLTPAIILSTPDVVLEEVAKKVEKELGISFSKSNVLEILVDIFENVVPTSGNRDRIQGEEMFELPSFVEFHRASRRTASDSHFRTKLSSQLVGEGVEAVEVELNEKFPMLSIAKLNAEAHAKVEVLKQYTYVTTIYSSRVSLPEFRGYAVVKSIFNALSGERGYLLMPDDVRYAHNAHSGNLDAQMRIVCDFVAGMTDRYAMEFFGRLHSEGAQSMFKPL